MGFILDASGYDATLPAQSDSAKAAISFMYNWLPVILIVVTFVIMLTYKLDKEMPKIHEELEKRNK